MLLLVAAVYVHACVFVRALQQLESTDSGVARVQHADVASYLRAQHTDSSKNDLFD
jgi:hypothetical protein